MDNLQIYLPKDIVNIIEEYTRDRTNYDKVINQLTILCFHVQECIDNGMEESFIRHLFRAHLRHLRKRPQYFEKNISRITYVTGNGEIVSEYLKN